MTRVDAKPATRSSVAQSVFWICKGLIGVRIRPPNAHVVEVTLLVVIFAQQATKLVDLPLRQEEVHLEVESESRGPRIVVELLAQRGEPLHAQLAHLLGFEDLVQEARGL